jgi:hypothetical protein
VPIKIRQYAACINNLAAWKAIFRGGISVDPFKPPKFPSKVESDSWISAQVHPHYYTSLPVVSLREAAHAGLIYNGRRLRTWKTTAAGDDLGSPEPIEESSAGDATACSASFFLEGSDFEVLEREARTQRPERTGHLEKALSHWVIDMCDTAYSLYPSVTVELLMMVFGSYQLHIEIEHRADYSRRRWWASGWNRLTERNCRQIAHRVQQYLNHEVDRLSLLLPPDDPLLPHHRSLSQGTRSPVKLAPPDDNVSSEAQGALVEAAENATATPPDNRQELQTTTQARAKRKSAKGRRRLFTDEELTKAGVLKKQNLTWLDITRQLRPGARVDERLHEKLADSFRHYQNRYNRRIRAAHPNNSSE